MPAEELAANPGEAKNSNFELIYKNEGEESHLVSFMYEYRSADI